MLVDRKRLRSITSEREEKGSSAYMTTRRRILFPEEDKGNSLQARAAKIRSMRTVHADTKQQHANAEPFRVAHVDVLRQQVNALTIKAAMLDPECQPIDYTSVNLVLESKPPCNMVQYLSLLASKLPRHESGRIEFYPLIRMVYLIHYLHHHFTKCINLSKKLSGLSAVKEGIFPIYGMMSVHTNTIVTRAGIKKLCEYLLGQVVSDEIVDSLLYMCLPNSDGSKSEEFKNFMNDNLRFNARNYGHLCPCRETWRQISIFQNLDVINVKGRKYNIYPPEIILCCAYPHPIKDINIYAMHLNVPFLQLFRSSHNIEAEKPCLDGLCLYNNMGDCNFNNVVMRRTTLRYIQMDNMQIAHADCSNSDWEGMQADTINLCDTDLSSVNLKSVVLKFAIISGTKFNGAQFDQGSQIILDFRDSSMNRLINGLEAMPTTRDKIQHITHVLFDHINNGGSVLTAIDSIDDEYATLKIGLVSKCIDYLIPVWPHVASGAVESMIEILTDNPIYCNNSTVRNFVVGYLFGRIVKRGNSHPISLSPQKIKLFVSYLQGLSDDHFGKLNSKNSGFFIQLMYAAQTESRNNEEMQEMWSILCDLYKKIPVVLSIANQLANLTGDNLDLAEGQKIFWQEQLIYLHVNDSGEIVAAMAFSPKYLQVHLYGKKTPDVSLDEITWQTFYLFTITHPDVDSGCNHQVSLNTKSTPLDTVFKDFVLFSRIYVAAQHQDLREQFFNILNLGEYRESFFSAMQVREISSLYESKHEHQYVTPEHQTKLRDKFNVFLSLPSEDEKSVEASKKVALTESHEQWVISNFCKLWSSRLETNEEGGVSSMASQTSVVSDTLTADNAVAAPAASDGRGESTTLVLPNTNEEKQKVSQIFLCLTGMFIKFSSNNFFGTPSESPEAIRLYAYALLSSAKKYNDELPKQDKVFTEDNLKDFTARLLGVGQAFTCAAVLSNDIVLFVMKNCSDVAKKIIPPAW